MSDEKKLCGAVLAGGIGSRLAPLSTDLRPKQFIKGLVRDSFDCCAKLAVERATRLTEKTVCVGSLKHAGFMPELGVDIILESDPVGTAKGIELAARHFVYDYHLMLVLPADHWVAPEFFDEMKHNLEIAEVEKFTLFGLDPEKVVRHNGQSQYGWIYPGPPVQFQEKPEIKPEKGWLVNSGMFLVNPEFYLELFSTHTECGQAGPVDKVILEKMSGSDDLRVLPLNCEWSDLGTWNALLEHHGAKSKDEFLGRLI